MRIANNLLLCVPKRHRCIRGTEVGLIYGIATWNHKKRNCRSIRFLWLFVTFRGNSKLPLTA